MHNQVWVHVTVNRDNRPYQILAMAIIVFLFGASIELGCQSVILSTGGSSLGFNVLSEVENLPEANILLKIEDSIAGTTVVAAVECHATLREGEDVISIGFNQYSLSVEDGTDAIAVSGLSYSYRSEYPFAYANDEVVIGSWGSHSPTSTSGNPLHPFPIWDSHSIEGQDYESQSSVAVDQITSIGYVLEYGDIQLCFENGASFAFGPAILSIGVNYTRDVDGWAVSFIIDSSGEYNPVTSEATLYFAMEGEAPIDPYWSSPSTVTVEDMFMLVPANIAGCGLVALLGVAVVLLRKRLA